MKLALIHDLREALAWYLNTYIVHLSNLDTLVVSLTAVLGIIIILFCDPRGHQAFILKSLRRCPGFKHIVQRRINAAIADVYETIHTSHHIEYQTVLPEHGQSSEKILQQLHKYRAAELVRWNEGYTSGTVYPRDPDLDNLAAKVFKEFLWTNPLHADIFPDVRRMEAEVVRMCLDMYHGDKKACGVVTSGGTESIMLACLAYRDLARSKGIKKPTMVIPASAHPAFDKAAHYFDMEVVHIPVDPESFMVEVPSMEQAITSEVCMLVGSAPGFPHGILDPIAQIARLGHRYGIPVHVDCCLGGFLLPFMEAAGYPVECFDFRLPGVTSISCDTHKYGFAAKGTSVIMYRSKHYRSMQFFAQPSWSGGLYASPTFAGSRSGALIAVCWATMMHFGQRGYIDSTRRIIKTTRYITKELRNIPGLVVLGNPQVSVVAFTSQTFNIFQLSADLSDRSSGRGWSLNNLQFPSAVHLCVTDMHTAEGRADRFLHDVRNVVNELMENPTAPVKNAAAMYGLCATLPDRSIVADVAKGYLDACYDTPTPKRSTSSQNHR